MNYQTCHGCFVCVLYFLISKFYFWTLMTSLSFYKITVIDVWDPRIRHWNQGFFFLGVFTWFFLFSFNDLKNYWINQWLFLILWSIQPLKYHERVCNPPPLDNIVKSKSKLLRIKSWIFDDLNINCVNRNVNVMNDKFTDICHVNVVFSHKVYWFILNPKHD